MPDVGFQLTLAVTIPVLESILIPVAATVVTGVAPVPVTVIVSIENTNEPDPLVSDVVPFKPPNATEACERPAVVIMLEPPVIVIVSLTIIVIAALELEPTKSVTVTVSTTVPFAAVGPTLTIPVTESMVIPV